ncbi:unnamed protein product [Heligmosomoides polygyrus]|uniref:Endo/exonuclease/phosphatase domain-containing protein n=1 Tax=Heligmosomoides polygyrus TaxID=6339 RepID=A0A183FZZ6_HELPZ|nr:unnamed protein product [Heligmosomoides polygyrus]
MDRIRNNVIRQKFDVVPIAVKMLETRLRWNGHVSRGEEDRVCKTLNFEAKGPCDRPACEHPCHITWCMLVHVYRDSATASAGADAHSQNAASMETIRGSLMRGQDRRATELVRKSRNVSRTRVATLNVGTLTGRSCECVEALERRRVDLCAVQETRWSCRKSRDIGRGFKAVLCGSPRTTGGVGVMISERFRDSIVGVERFDDRLMKVVVAAKERPYHFFSAYAPQTGCSDQAKDEIWNLLDEMTAEVPTKDVIIVAGDLNGHVGATKDGYSCHGGFGHGSRNADGGRILEYAESHNLTIVNTVFRKRDSHLISCYSGSTKTQIDFVPVKDRDRNLVTDEKIVPYETVAPQHLRDEVGVAFSENGVHNGEIMRFRILENTLTIGVTRPVSETTMTAVPVLRSTYVPVKSIRREEVIESLLSGDNDLHQSIVKALDAYNRVTKSFGDD